MQVLCAGVLSAFELLLLFGGFRVEGKGPSHRCANQLYSVRRRIPSLHE